MLGLRYLRGGREGEESSLYQEQVRPGQTQSEEVLHERGRVYNCVQRGRTTASGKRWMGEANEPEWSGQTGSPLLAALQECYSGRTRLMNR